MRGIIACGAYVPYRRLQRSDIAAFFGGAEAKGTRSVASFDEDATTMAVEACRIALRAAGQPGGIDALWLSTAEPPYLERTNATAVHAALRMDASCLGLDMGCAVRSGIGALRSALDSNGTILAVSSGMRTGLPTSADESGGGDGAAACLVGDAGAVIAEHIGSGSVTEEFLDRWRSPGGRSNRHWEERFAETRYVPIGEEAWRSALKEAGIDAGGVDTLVVTGVHERAVRSLSGRLGVDKDKLAGTLADTVGNTGAAHPALLLTSALESAQPGQVIAVVSLADGADVLVFRATPAIARYRPTRSVAAQVERGGSIPYSKFLSWRGMVEVQPPNRPTPNRPSASAAARNEDWKFAFVATRDRATGIVHIPPSRVGIKGGSTDDMDLAPMADVPATIVTCTIDRLIYSESPPVVFAVLDFDGGGRFACEMTDVDAQEVAMGQRVEMTFRRMFTADGIHNYFWKARPLRY